MARKIPGLQRVLDAPALFSVAYGEIASSIYIALGIIALHALGLTPEVLAIVGALFLVVTLTSDTLHRLEQAAKTDENLLPHILACVEAYATVGEISNTLRRVWGEYRETSTI